MQSSLSASCDKMPWAPPPLWRWRTLPAQVLSGGYRTVEAAAKAGSTRANSSCVSPGAARNSRGLSCKVAKVSIEQIDTISDQGVEGHPSTARGGDCERPQSMRHSPTVLLFGMFVAHGKDCLAQYVRGLRQRLTSEAMVYPHDGGARAVCLPPSERTSPAPFRAPRAACPPRAL